MQTTNAFLLVVAVTQTLLTPGQSQSATPPRLFPYGAFYGGTQLPTTDDGNSGPITLRGEIPFFGGRYDVIYVNANGDLSFGRGNDLSVNRDFPLGARYPPFIAAYWADVDLWKGGEIWYRETIESPWVERATREIRSTAGGERFTAFWLFIVTWRKVAFFGASFQGQRKRNTFQLVLAVDAAWETAYVIMNYRKLQWTCGTSSGGHKHSGLGWRHPAVVGFSAGDGRRFAKLQGSKSDRVMDLVTTSNSGSPGRWIVKISVNDIAQGAEGSVIRAIDPEEPTTPDPPVTPADTTQDAGSSFSCVGRPVGQYRDPASSSMFYECHGNGVTNHRACPENTEWSQGSRSCRRVSQGGVVCPDLDLNPDASTLIADPNNKCRYFQCGQGGAIHSMPCAPGTKFDDGLDQCVHLGGDTCP